MRPSSSLGLSVVIAITSTVVGCRAGSRCEPVPASAGLAVGETIEVEIEIVDGGWSSLDVGGVYWSTDAPVPEELPTNGPVKGLATLASSDGDSPEQITSGTVALVLSTGDVIPFEGPISCN